MRALLLAGALCACQGTGSKAAGTPAAPVSLEPGAATPLVLRPARAQLAPAAPQQFSVTGSPGDDVAWTVEEGAAGGAISPAGAYAAPAAPGVYHVTATSRADGSRRATSTVVVSAARGALVVTPASVTLRPGAPWTFTAQGSEGGVSWWVIEADGGAIDADGRYTAPAAEGVYHVVAASADGAQKEAAEVTVSAGGAPSSR